MREAPGDQPPAQRGWRRRRRHRPWHGIAARAGRVATRVRVRALLALLLAAAVVLAIVALARRAERPDPLVAIRQGEAALAQANYSAARYHFLTATGVAPGNATAQLGLARANLLLGEGVAVEGAVDRAAAAGANPATLHPLRAAARQLQDDADGAIAEAAQASGDPLAQRARARAMADKGDTVGGVALLQTVLARHPRDAAAWVDLGRIRWNLGDVAGAGEAVQRALAADRACLSALVLAGEVVRSRYGLNAALPWFAAALRRDPYYHPALAEYAATLGDLGRNGEAVAAARRALMTRRNSPQGYYLLAVIAARAGNRQLAADLLDRSGGALDGLPGGLLLSGATDYAAGRLEQAAVKWRALLDRQPMNLVARRLLGAALLRSGDAAGTLAVLRPIALRGDADSYTLTLVARAFEAQGKRDWAARFLDRAAAVPHPFAAPFGQDDSQAVLADAVSKVPDDPRAAVAYVRGLLENGRGAEATALAQRIARQTPGAPAAAMLLGDLDAAAGRWAAAARDYARAADLRFDQSVMLRLVEARAMAGDRRGAAQALALFLSQNPQNIAARRTLANLQRAAGDDEAIDTLERLRTDLGMRDDLLLASLSGAYSDADDPATGLALARAACRLQPMRAAAADAYGWALLGRGQVAAALQLLDKAAQAAPGDATIAWHRAQALAGAHRPVEARAAIAALLRRADLPDRDGARRLLASLPPG